MVGILSTQTDRLSAPLAAPSVIFGHANMALQGLCAEIRNHWRRLGREILIVGSTYRPTLLDQSRCHC